MIDAKHTKQVSVPYFNYSQTFAKVDSESDSESSDSEEENVGLGGDVFHPFDKGAIGKSYERVIPKYVEDCDDLFMKSVMEKYALEGKDEDTEKPTGVFTLDETQAKALAQEVLGTHKGLSGAAFKSYMDTYWAKAWGHFDVNKSGAIPATQAPMLMRFLASDQYFQL